MTKSDDRTPKEPPQNQIELLGFVGVGLDGTDGHTRITTGEESYLLGGSESTHELMQEMLKSLGASEAQSRQRQRDIAAAKALEILRRAREA